MQNPWLPLAAATQSQSPLTGPLQRPLALPAPLWGPAAPASTYLRTFAQAATCLGPSRPRGSPPPSLKYCGITQAFPGHTHSRPPPQLLHFLLVPFPIYDICLLYLLVSASSTNSRTMAGVGGGVLIVSLAHMFPGPRTALSTHLVLGNGSAQV